MDTKNIYCIPELQLRLAKKKDKTRKGKKTTSAVKYCSIRRECSLFCNLEKHSFPLLRTFLLYNEKSLKRTLFKVMTTETVISSAITHYFVLLKSVAEFVFLQVLKTAVASCRCL
jgi:hypothetical protein